MPRRLQLAARNSQLAMPMHLKTHLHGVTNAPTPRTIRAPGPRGCVDYSSAKQNANLFLICGVDPVLDVAGAGAALKLDYLLKNSKPEKCFIVNTPTERPTERPSD